MINDELSFDLLGRSYPQNDDEKTGKRNKENDGPYAEDILWNIHPQKKTGVMTSYCSAIGCIHRKWEQRGQKQEGKDDKKTHTVETQCGVFTTGVLAADRSL